MTSISNPTTSQGARQGLAKPSSIQTRTGTTSTTAYGQSQQLLAASAEGTGQNLTDMIQKREISSTYIKRILDNQQMIK